MKPLFGRDPGDAPAPEAAPAGWDGLGKGAKLALASVVVLGGVGLVVFGGGGESKKPQAVGAEPRPNDRLNEYDNPPPAGGVVQDAVNRVTASVNTAFGAPTGPRRRAPTEMALYAAPASSVGAANRDGRAAGAAAEMSQANGYPNGGGDPGEDRLASHLANPTVLQASRAVPVRNRSYIIRAGADIPCLPVDAQNSGLPGFTKCRVPEWFRSDDQRRGLLPPGTLIFGQLRNGVARGQMRLGVLYTRIQAPRFDIALAAPGADALGRAGLEAEEQTFFWDRAGAVALYSLFDIAIGAGQAAGTAALSGAIGGGRGGTVLNLGGVGGQAQGLASQEMQSRVNRPSVLTRDQALPMTVTVGQDLDFSAVCKQAMQVDLMACPLM